MLWKRLDTPPFGFELLPQGKGSYLKKLNVKTLPFSWSNRGHQSCNVQGSPLSWPLSFVHFAVWFLFNLRCHFHKYEPCLVFGSIDFHNKACSIVYYLDFVEFYLSHVLTRALFAIKNRCSIQHWRVGIEFWKKKSRS